jgi:hypothetical protein
MCPVSTVDSVSSLRVIHLVHEVARQDEQWNRQQSEVLGLGDGELDGNREGQLRVLQEEQRSGNANGKRHGHSDEDEHDECAEHEQHPWSLLCERIL